MKKSFCCLIIALAGTTFAQTQRYTFSDDSFTYLVTIYNDVSIGEVAFGLNTYFGDSVDYEDPISIVEFDYLGIDVPGTLHLQKDSNNYSIDTEELSDLSVVPGETLTFAGELSSPDLEMIIEERENGKISMTLVNASEFEAFTE